MKFWILVNANDKIGGGHLRRCLDLADVISAKYPKEIMVQFITWSLDRQYESLFQNFEILKIEEKNLIDSLENLNFENKDFFLVDVNSERVHSLEFQSFLRNFGFRTAYFLANYNWEYNCDFLINTSPLAKMKDVKVTSNTRCLFGPEFFIFRKSFRYIKNIHQKRENKIFICFGNADPEGYTIRMIQYLMHVCVELEIVVVIGSSNRTMDLIYELKDKLPSNIRLVFNEMDVLPYMLNAKFAITSVGSMFYELTVLQIPSVLFPSSEMEDLVANHLCEMGYAKLGMKFGGNWNEELLNDIFENPFEVNITELNSMLNLHGIEKIVEEFKLEKHL